jgi:hypothetical protein
MSDNTVGSDPLLAEAARAARPYLSELVGEDAARIDGELAGLLESAQAGADVTAALSARLDRPEALRDWVAAFLELGRPPQISSPVLRGYSALPGMAQPALTRRFVCPFGDYVWYASGLGRTPPACPTHGLRLIAAGPADPG